MAGVKATAKGDRRRQKRKIVFRNRPYPKPKPTFENAPDLLTTTEAARFLNISKAHLYKLMEEGVLRVTLVNKPNAKRVRYRFLKEDVATLRNRRVVFTKKEVNSYDK